MNLLSLKRISTKKLVFATILLLVFSFSVAPFFASPIHAQEETENGESIGNGKDTSFTQKTESPTEALNKGWDVVGSVRAPGCGESISCHVVWALRYMIIGGLGALGSFFALFLGLAASFLKMMVFLGTRVVELPVVSTGFSLTLSFTNVLFILAIIFIAFATILRIESWSAKANLKRLVIAAILVNFSFFIAGFILDTTNTFTGVFSGAFEPTALGETLNPQQIILAFGADVDRVFYSDGTEVSDVTDGSGASLKALKQGAVDKQVVGLQMPLNTDDWGQFFTILQGLLLAVFLTVILTVSLFSLGIMLLVRNFYIAFLIVLMPLIWPLSVIPALKDKWSKWWDSFLKWAIFLPTVSFFIWLAVTSTRLMNQAGVGTVGNQLELLVKGDPFAHILLMLFNTLFVAGLMLAGLFVSRKLAVFGSAAGLVAAGWIGAKITGGSKVAGKFAGRYALRNPGKVITAAGAVAAGPLGALGAAGAFGAGRAGARGAKNYGGKKLRQFQAWRAKKAAESATGKGGKALVGRILAGDPSREDALAKANILAGKASATEAIKKLQEKFFSNATNAMMESFYDKKNPRKLPPGDNMLAALMQETKQRKLGKKITVTDANRENIKALFEATKRAYNVDDITDAPAGEGVPGWDDFLTANPQLAAIEIDPKDTTAVEAAIQKFAGGLSGSDALNVKKWDLPTITGINPSALKHVIERGSDETVAQIKKLLNAKLSTGDLLTRMDTLESDLTTAKDMLVVARRSGNKESIEAAEKARDKTTSEIKKALKDDATRNLYGKYSILKRAKVGEFSDLVT